MHLMMLKGTFDTATGTDCKAIMDKETLGKWMIIVRFWLYGLVYGYVDEQPQQVCHRKGLTAQNKKNG
jgi:hypothetical protein